MSKWAVIIGCLALAWSALVYYPKWKMPRTEATISWDVSGYYLYLPALFIYGDLKKLEFKKSIDEKYYPSSSPYQSFTHRSGNQVMKYTGGLAILYSPFFLVAHFLAKTMGLTADGYSPVYQFFISAGSLIYAFIGLIGLRWLLLKYCSDTVVGLSIWAMVLGTNYFDYASITGAMSHNYLFTLYVGLLICTYQFYYTNKVKWFYGVCFIMGLMALIRPTELISGILVIGWGINSWDALKNRFRFLLSHLGWLMKGFGIFLICPLIQIVYWKYVSGEWIVYSYQEQGFSWLEGHHILQGLFSYRAGWLVYSPLMVLSLVGIVLMWVFKSSWKWMVTAFVLASLYLTFAWDEWTYGGSLGQRALVQHYPVFILGITTAFKYGWPVKPVKLILIISMVLATYYNLWLTHHAHRGGIYEAGMMNKAYFWHTLLQSENNPESKKILDTNEPPVVLNERTAIVLLDTIYAPDSISCPKGSAIVDLFQGKITAGKFKVDILVSSPRKEWDTWQMAQLVVQFVQGEDVVKTVLIRLHRFLNDGDESRIDLTTTGPAKNYEKVKVYVWNPSQNELCIKGLKIYASSEK